MTASCSLIIPLYNEVASIQATLKAAREALKDCGCEWEIIVVDDGSTDGGAAAAEMIESVRLVRHEKNRGYGAALKTGFAAARHDVLAFMDADGSYPAADLPKLLEAADEADMVIGERSTYNHYSSAARQLGKTILLPLANYLTGEKIPDLNSGMRVVHRKLLERYWPLLPDGFSLTTTLTMAFLSSGRCVRWLPIDFHKREGKSKIRPVRDMTNFMLLILRTVTYFHPLKVYLPACIFFILASFLVTILSELISGEVMDVTALFLFIFGLQLLLIGVLADLVLKILGTRT